MLSSMKYYGVCQCLYQQYRLFYHVDCDKQHDQNSFPMVITFIITTTRGRDNVCSSHFSRTHVKSWLPYYYLYIMILNYVY